MNRDDLVGLKTAAEQVGRSSFLEFDPDKYLREIESFDLTETQKVELLSVLFQIMRGMVDLGFDLGTAEICGRFNVAAHSADSDIESIIAETTESTSTETGGTLKNGKH